ncbi:MIP family channel protein [Colletotrichum abscissum]|uniref:MIP family channel protein n=4 Tax=Colletotrichum acutatum species complex TaxID=2707335 RepID=A0A9P9XMV2_9PEZI|nr:MIP family channel protein [Colletotrichum lupini]XP_060318003.1 MIP family channel protein [Colletotrichum costaricense]XP_060375497.1 MIP family channel protein [Colletotrichum tamarilloi]XP_060391474.1 MIP family channel protein [Colletotrichum abscissum]KAI3534340.1 MIP family channel protein [Colletotrichum filicis]KAI3556386.1 MIP family channel protein [Colletotrichum abscissum]KAK1475567.1 MIP family channel protein [Colletotrichum abscissum]KAK1481664.1 MIP family channel protein
MVITVHTAESVSESSSVGKQHIPTYKHDMGGEETHEEHAVGSMLPPHHEEEQLWWSRIRENCQEGFSEFFGTMIMILFGDGVVAQVVLSNSTKGDYQSISWGWGLAVMLGVYVGKKSGGHLNPAVTLANCVYRGHPWRKFPVYFMGQLLGAMAGAFIVYGNYISAIDAFEGGPGIRTVGGANSTAGIFCTYPAAFMTRTGMFFSEIVASTILMFSIFALADPTNGAAGPFMPLALFFLIFGIGACFGWETGYAINLARDFGPRLVSYILGYGSEVWSAGGYYFWIPMVAPFFGTLFGGFLYDVFIFTGESPINTPYFGLTRLFRPRRDVWSNTYKNRLEKV